MEWTKNDFLDMYNSYVVTDDDILNFVRNKIQSEADKNGVPIRQLSNDEIFSIAYRLKLLIERSHSELADISNTTDKYIHDLVVRKDKENYANIPYGDRWIDISFKDTKSARYLLDVDNCDIVLRSMQKVKSNIVPVDSYKVSSYCFSDRKLLSKVLFPKRNMKYVYDDDLENLIVCDRFDPVDNYTFKGFWDGKKATHINNFDVLKSVKSEEELELMKKYYGDSAPVPHFHFGTKSYAIQNRGGQLAITLKNLSQYLKDLDLEFTKYQKGEADDFKLLQYDIGIPFFQMTTDKMKFDFDNFFDKMKGTLRVLERSVHNENKENIKELYNLLEYFYRREGQNQPLRFISRVVDFVDEMSSDLEPKHQSKIMYILQDSCNHVKHNVIKRNKNIDNTPDEFTQN